MNELIALKLVLLICWYYNMQLILNSKKLKATSKSFTILIMAIFSFSIISL